MAASTSATSTGAIVGVFDDAVTAQQAVCDLRAAGYTENQIGIASHEKSVNTQVSNHRDQPDSMSEESAAATTGVAIGASAGALWGLGILAGVLPGIGTAIAGGTLGVLLSSAAAGAAVASVGVALATLGLSDEDAAYYENEFKAGRTIVTVHGAPDVAEAKRILSRYSASNRPGEIWLD